jgi:ABC-type multidrug transport system fused ATPase/permease subunit
MIRDAPVLVLDEPTAGLDVESWQRLREPLARLMGGRTTIIISHNLLMARDATSVLVLQGGRVAERGTHSELLARGGTYAGLYRLHQDPRPQSPEVGADAGGREGAAAAAIADAWRSPGVAT